MSGRGTTGANGDAAPAGDVTEARNPALRVLRRYESPAKQSRAESVAKWLEALADDADPGERLGSKQELRTSCGVSVGTFNEAIRLAQARGVLTVRPGPGGGLFAAAQSPMVRLGNSVLALDSDQTSVAEAMRIRDALDPLTVEDALEHSSPADLAAMRAQIALMEQAATGNDPEGFVHANWRLHAIIADVSPHPMLRSLYRSVLDIVESHTLAVLPTSEQPLPDYIAQRHRLHADLVESIAVGDAVEARRLIDEHNTTAPSR